MTVTTRKHAPTSSSSSGGVRVLKQTSTNRFVLLVVKVLLVLLILLILPKLVIAKSGGRLNTRIKRQKRRRGEILIGETRKICEMEVCVHLIPEDSMNCIQLCISPACYQKTYNARPLEDGEIDIERAREFELCAKNELKETRKLQRTKPEMFGE